jgi:hypothetical protein
MTTSIERDPPLFNQGDEVKTTKSVDIPFPCSNDRNMVITLPEGFVGEVVSKDAVPKMNGGYVYNVRFELLLGPVTPLPDGGVSAPLLNVTALSVDEWDLEFK